MCCGSSSSSTEVKLPDWLKEPAKRTIARVESFYDKPYQVYGGQRQAGFQPDQMTAFQALRDYVSGGGTSGLATEGTGYIRSGATAPGAAVDTERVVDEGGRLGAMSDYMNPYLSGVLQPALREIDEGAAQERKRIGSMAQTAGAFGDARHGILESELGEDVMRARGDVTGQIFSDAFNTAMGYRSGDLDRFFNEDITNANLYETALGRLMEGGGAITGQATQQQGDFLERLSALLSTGTTQQQQAQTALDIPYQEFEKGKQDEYDRIAALISVIGGVPYERKTTSTQPRDSSGAFGALGSLLGGIF